MMNENNKSVKMLEELINYFLSHQIKNLTMNLALEKDQTIIMVSGHCLQQPDDLDQIKASLNHPRQPEVEEYYWRLLGSSKQTSQMHLLGALVDDGNIMYDDHVLTIELKRFK